MYQDSEQAAGGAANFVSAQGHVQLCKGVLSAKPAQPRCLIGLAAAQSEQTQQSLAEPLWVDRLGCRTVHQRLQGQIRFKGDSCQQLALLQGR